MPAPHGLRLKRMPGDIAVAGVAKPTGLAFSNKGISSLNF
jgi:hypothetical protein